jgi:uncharacterized SAM-binding protein YcdF (DUF218 family)
MYFLAKLSQFLINPSTWLVVLVLLVYFTKNTTRKKRWSIVAVIAFLLLTNGALYKATMHAWQASPVLLTTTYQTGIVLGGMAGVASNGNGYFGEAGDRFIQTLKLYNQGIIKKIIISGGDGSLQQKGPKEADFVCQEFIKNKVPAADVIIENRSRNTYENALYSKKIVDSLGFAAPAVLITSATHMRRSLLLFAKAGLPVTGYPCNFKTLDNKYHLEDFLPNFGVVEKWSYLFKEWLGILVYKISGKA